MTDYEKFQEIIEQLPSPHQPPDEYLWGDAFERAYFHLHAKIARLEYLVSELRRTGLTFTPEALADMIETALRGTDT